MTTAAWATLSKARPRPTLGAVLLTAAWALPAAVVVLVGVFYGLEALVPPGEKTAQRTLDIAKVTLAFGAVIGAVLTGIYAFRQQVLVEKDALRSDTELFHGRLTKASELLADERPAARLAGIYSMAALADDWEDGRQVCIDVLCAYLQLPYKPDGGEKEVRRTLIRVIRDHLRKDKSMAWCGCYFRFENATFDGGDLSGARFLGNAYVNFHGAKFIGRETFFLSGIRIGDKATLGFTDVTFNGPVKFDGMKVAVKDPDVEEKIHRSERLTFKGATVNSPDQVTFDDMTLVSGPPSSILGGVFDERIRRALA